LEHRKLKKALTVMTKKGSGGAQKTEERERQRGSEVLTRFVA
jgi:hypothetical protein